MSQLAATQISKPRDEQAFERASLVLWRCILKDPNIQTNAGRGQAQNGVDIFGFRNEDPFRPVGIQCKLKGEGKKLTEAEIREEVELALSFKPPLREYFIVTTANDSGDQQQLARELTVEASKSGRRIAINVWGWQTLEQRISIVCSNNLTDELAIVFWRQARIATKFFTSSYLIKIGFRCTLG